MNVCARPVAAVATLTLILSGCGGRRQAESTPQRGRAVFAAACAGCHTLTGRDSRAPGGDLAIARLSAADIASFVRVMPVHLTPADVQAVAAYVHAAAMRSGR